MVIGRWGDRTPAEVRELVGGRGPRVLAWCAAGDSGYAAATQERFCCSDPLLDVRWPQILGAAWDAPLMELTLWGEGAAETVRLHLSEAGVLPQVVRERIMASLLVQQHVAIQGDIGVRFLARRDPATDEVSWQRVLDPGLDVDDPQVVAAVDRAQQELQQAFGV